MSPIDLSDHRFSHSLMLTVRSGCDIIAAYCGTILLATCCLNVSSVKCHAVEQAPPSTEAAFQSDEAGFQKQLGGFLADHCVRCHGAEKAEGEFRVDRDLSAHFDQLATKSKWGEVVNVLNSHEMPPEDEPQPAPESVATFVDWVTEQMVKAELLHREATVVMRRLNRDEYHNTILDLTGVDFDTSHFPQDPPAGGFDNNGRALSMSPLLLELYYDAAATILDRAFVTGDAPPSIRWRFEPESGDSDSNRVTYDDQRLIVNGGKNRVETDAIVMHHESWDRTFNVRDFRLKHAGPYMIRIHAGARVPDVTKWSKQHACFWRSDATMNCRRIRKVKSTFWNNSNATWSISRQRSFMTMVHRD